MITIAVTNQKGGVGKSVISAELAYLFATKGYATCLISVDQQADLEMNLGVINSDNTNTIHDVLSGKCNIKDALIDIFEANPDMDEAEAIKISKSEQNKINYYFVRSDMRLANASAEFAKPTDIFLLKESLENINDIFDICIIDTAPARDTIYNMSLVASDYVFIPCDTSDGALTGAMKVYMDLQQYVKYNMSHAKILGIILNNCQPKSKVAKVVLKNLEQLAREMDTIIFDPISTSVKVREAEKFRQTVNYCTPDEKASLQFRKLAKDILKIIKAEENENGK